jgi:hypothetical protein
MHLPIHPYFRGALVGVDQQALVCWLSGGSLSFLPGFHFEWPEEMTEVPITYLLPFSALKGLESP